MVPTSLNIRRPERPTRVAPPEEEEEEEEAEEEEEEEEGVHLQCFEARSGSIQHDHHTAAGFFFLLCPLPGGLVGHGPGALNARPKVPEWGTRNGRSGGCSGADDAVAPPSVLSRSDNM